MLEAKIIAQDETLALRPFRQYAVRWKMTNSGKMANFGMLREMTFRVD